MEILLLIIGVILIALSLTILLISKKNAPSEDGKETLRELERFKEEQAKAQSELRRELSEGVQRSVLTLGGVLRTQQEQSDKALKEQIHMMDRSMQEKQTAHDDEKHDDDPAEHDKYSAFT